MIDAAYGEWLARGQAHQQAGLPIDAMLCFRQALKANRHAVQAQFHLGESLRDLGQRDEAIVAWRAALTLQPRHVPSLLALADVLRRSSANADAAAHYRQALAVEPQHAQARAGLALASLATGDDNALTDVGALLGVDASDFGVLDELARLIASLPESPSKHALLAQIDLQVPGAMPPLLLAVCAEDAALNDEAARLRGLLERAAAFTPPIDNPEALRHLALATADAEPPSAWGERYATRCAQVYAPVLPALWPRRTAGDALRIAWLIAPGRPLVVAGVEIDIAAYLEHVVAVHARASSAVVVFSVDRMASDTASARALQGLRVAALGSAPDPALARALAEADYDALIDLAGLPAGTGPLLAARPARSLWTYTALDVANLPPLITHALPPLAATDARSLAEHRAAIEAALAGACRGTAWFADTARLSAEAMSAQWRAAVAAHQAGRPDAAMGGYRSVLDEQPGFAPAHYLSGVLLRDRGQPIEAEAELRAALAVAPAYAEARASLANLRRESGDADGAAALCREGLAFDDGDPGLWRALGLAELARRDAAAARDAFARALALAPVDAQTHYNHGVALQTLLARDDALRAYQRALVLAPDMLAADFNIGVVFQEQGRTDAAIGAFEKVLAREPRHVLAHKALGDTLLAARRIDDWLRVFDRFEAICPNALALAAQALEVYQYRGDFAALDRYLDRLRQDDFKPENETELTDSLEQLLFLLLYFDVEPETQLAFYRAYDAVARRVYGAPLARPTARRPGRLRIGYLSGDMRNHVMGKMMWEAIRHHDRGRFEVFCYATSGEIDDWTERYRGFADHFQIVAGLTERDAAQRIAADDLDVLVDLSTHTKNAKPGVLAFKPARVQITHIASSGAVGLSAVDFKLTDAYCDLPENQPFLLETLLPMAGCVYPYRHVAPVAEHPFHRDQLRIPADAILIGAFVNPLKLSRRCLSLWREVLQRIPRAMLAISPLSPEARAVYGRLLGAASIAHERVIVLPQGRNDAEGQARYRLLDFALDPLPYGGVNSTLEALDMGLPVVTLRGRKHGERTSYSILANLGVLQTVAKSGSEYVDIAARLASDAAFLAEVKAAIAAGLAASGLTDMPRHTRALEAAYEQALARTHPDVLAQAVR